MTLATFLDDGCCTVVAVAAAAVQQMHSLGMLIVVQTVADSDDLHQTFRVID